MKPKLPPRKQNPQLQRAIALHQSGKLAEAAVLYKKLLSFFPKHSTILTNLGTIALQQGNLEEGIMLIGKSLDISPNQPGAYCNRGNALKELRRLDEALASYDRAIALKPDFAEAYSNRGNALRGLKRPNDALASYDRAIAVQPDYAEAYSNRGNALKDLLRLNDAVASYEHAIALKPDYAEAHSNRGLVLQDLHRLDEALASYDRALALKPDFAEAYSNRGNAFMELRRLDDALASYDHAIALKRGYAEAHSNRGLALQDLLRLDEAVASYDRALALNPDFAEAYSNRGNVLRSLKQLDEAIASYDRAIAVQPDYAEAYSNRGNALRDMQRLDDALASYERAIALKPGYAEAHYNRGLLFRDLARLHDALASHDRALALKPDYAEAYSGRANALRDLKRFDDALASYGRAIALKPDYAEAYCGRANALRGLRKFEDALIAFDHAIALKPDYAEAYYNRGNALNDLKRQDEALASFARAFSLKPGMPYVLGSLLHAKMHVCDWADFRPLLNQLVRHVRAREKAAIPFVVLGLADDPAIQQIAAEVFAKDLYPPHNVLPPITKHKNHNRIRIGYFSADFREHPVSLLTAELFETHDRAAFEVIAFSFGVDSKDKIRKRLEAAFDKFIDVRNLPDKDVALLSRNMRIDIAVDLGGFTNDSRTGIFAMRAAPIQTAYIGYLGTMGADYMDYLIADKTIIPDDFQQYYSEQIACLPRYQVNDSKRCIADKNFTREELGLPHAGFVYCCFNHNYKITPDTFDGWMRILKGVNDSVLYLLEGSDISRANLRKEAVLRGVDASRLIFGKRIPDAEYLARYRVADLFLDTHPYNAGTTASDALRVGLPVLTRIGKSFASRVAASLLNSVGLPELITDTQDAYVSLAIELGNNPGRINQIKNKLRNNVPAAPLYDTRLFTRNIESAYKEMYRRYQDDLLNEHIYIHS